MTTNNDGIPAPDLDHDFISLELCLRHHKNSDDAAPADLYRVFVPVEKGMRLIPDVTTLEDPEKNHAAQAFAAKIMTGVLAIQDMLCRQGYLTKCDMGMGVVMIGKAPVEADAEKWHGTT